MAYFVGHLIMTSRLTQECVPKETCYRFFNCKGSTVSPKITKLVNFCPQMANTNYMYGTWCSAVVAIRLQVPRIATCLAGFVFILF